MKRTYVFAIVLSWWVVGTARAENGQAAPGPSSHGAYSIPGDAMPEIPPAPGPSTGVPALRNGGFNQYQSYGAAAVTGPYWAPGGYEPRFGAPYYYHDPRGGRFVFTGDPYYDHWGPGFQRQDLHGHYRFPYYTYRAPWYYPGRAVYNRDTNFPW